MNDLARIQQKGIVMFFEEAGSPKKLLIIISLLCLYLVFLGSGVVFGTKLIQLPLSAWGQLIFLSFSKR
jgi:antibiotic biosynthesis monooxygenase (ABM) superfamily enzyme